MAALGTKSENGAEAGTSSTTSGHCEDIVQINQIIRRNMTDHNAIGTLVVGRLFADQADILPKRYLTGVTHRIMQGDDDEIGPQGCFIGQVHVPSTFGHLLQGQGDAGMDSLGGHARRQFPPG